VVTAWAVVARADPDGYTPLISREAAVMTVNPSVPAKTIAAFIAYAKANPGKINMASAGVGSPSHVTGELFKMMTGVNMVHVPYRGSPSVFTDLMAGQVQVTFQTMVGSIAHVRAGTVRALAVTTATRSEVLPDLPSVSEFVPGYEVSAVFGLGAPRNTPAEIIDKLNKDQCRSRRPQAEGAVYGHGHQRACGLTSRLSDCGRGRRPPSPPLVVLRMTMSLVPRLLKLPKPATCQFKPTVPMKLAPMI
jgi:hypothetical protein